VHLESGYTKELKFSRGKIIAKTHKDLKRISNLPSPQQLTYAVQKGFLALKSIGEQYSNIGTPLPSKTQGVANACIVGAIWCSTFGGRKMEWENMNLSQVNQMFENGVDFLICDEHKTSKTYGALAKWLPLV
jgi:hypothetical protein